MIKELSRLILVISLMFLQVYVAEAQPAALTARTAAENDSESKRRYETFLSVWKTINDHYFDRTFSGLNWNKVRAEYEPRVAAAESDKELYLLLQEMIHRLGRSHFSIIPPEVARELDEVRKEAQAIGGVEPGLVHGEKHGEDENDQNEFLDEDSVYGIGVELRMFGDQLVVSRVDPNSPAERAGIRPGYSILGVNDVLFSDFLKRIRALGAYAAKTEKQLPLEVVSWFFNSRSPAAVTVNYLDNSGRSASIEIPREKLSGELESLVPNLPRQFLRFESRPLNDDIGYIKFNFFTISTVDKVCQALSSFKDKRAIIIDLRGNLGGSYGTVVGLGGLFTRNQIKMGTEIHRTGSFIRDINPHRKNFKGELVILVDKFSYSAAEIFAAAMQDNGLATIVGEKTAGEALPAVTKILPTGAIFLYPVADFKTPNGNSLELRGVLPDRIISNDLESLRSQKDLQLTAAIAEARRKIMVTGSTEAVETKNSILPPPRPKSKANNAVTKKVQDARALRVILRSIESVGGADALRKITSYSATGTLLITDSGTQVRGKVEILRRAPDKFAENLIIDGSGEIREVFNGSEHVIQSKIFGTDQTVDKAKAGEIKLLADFYELLNAEVLYPKILYRGQFERDKRRVHLIEAADAAGSIVMFVFDSETGRLVNRTGASTVNSFGDYRRVGDIFYPFWQSRTDTVIYMLNEVKLNEEISDDKFEPTVNCFDKID